MKNKKNPRPLWKITVAAVMSALICVLTMVVRIPTPTNGYLNLGDCAVLLSGWLLGPLFGAFAAGVGSALADLFAGYPVYLPGTFIIKALMALMVSLVPRLLRGGGKIRLRVGFAVGAAIAECWMAAGYWLYEAFVIGEGAIAALAGVSGNIAQGVVGIVGAYFLVEIFSRTDIFRLCGTDGFVARNRR